ncbi:hypothetical protein LCGC14_1852400, partial [marine sediment metagenome]
MQTLRSTGIVGNWPLNAANVSLPTASDVSRNHNDGTLTNAVLAADGRSMVFAGADYITIPNANKYKFSNAMSAGGWIRKNDLSGLETIVSKYMSGGDEREWFILVEDQKIACSFGDPNDGTFQGTWTSDGNVITATGIFYKAEFTFNAGTVI